jgi:hypothetical protein
VPVDLSAKDLREKQTLDMTKPKVEKDQGETDRRRKAKMQAQRNFLAGLGAQKDVEE